MYLTNYCTHYLRIRWMRNVYARKLRLRRIYRDIKRLEKIYITCLNLNKTEASKQVKLLILNNIFRYDKLKFWFMKPYAFEKSTEDRFFQ